MQALGPASRVKVPCLRKYSYGALILPKAQQAPQQHTHAAVEGSSPREALCATPSHSADAPEEHERAALVRGPGGASLSLWAWLPTRLLRCLSARGPARGPARGARSCRRTCNGLDAEPTNAEGRHCETVLTPGQQLVPSSWARCTHGR